MSDLIAIRAGRTVLPTGVVSDALVVVEGERIVAAGPAQGMQIPDGAVPYECDVLLPGFIDLHVHGNHGNGFGDGTEAAVAAARAMAKSGVTTTYAGLGAGPSIDAIAETVATAAAAVNRDTGGARIAGIFMEGPFISPAKKGAWTAANLRTPSVAELHALVAASNDTIRRVNIAPELPGALEFIREARAQGIVISLGHTDATYAEAVAGIEAGATITNHTYNAMSPLDHRKPGMVGATLTRPELLAELILDFVHVDPVAASVLLRARGASGVALITDASMMAGQPDGEYSSSFRTVIVKGDSCRLLDGTLAGSVATFDQGLRNAAGLLGPDLEALTAMSSTNAARAMSIDTETGSISNGKFADLVLLDAGLHVEVTIVRGTVVFDSRSRQ